MTDSSLSIRWTFVAYLMPYFRNSLFSMSGYTMCKDTPQRMALTRSTKSHAFPSFVSRVLADSPRDWASVGVHLNLSSACLKVAPHLSLPYLIFIGPSVLATI